VILQQQKLYFDPEIEPTDKRRFQTKRGKNLCFTNFNHKHLRIKGFAELHVRALFIIIIIIIIIIIVALQPFVVPRPLFQFLNPIHSR
jgi:hypothetical protein